MPTEPENAQPSSGFSAAGVGRRRALLAAGAVLAAGVGAAAAELTDGGRPSGRTAGRTDAAGGPPPEAAIPFHAPRQAGVTFPQPAATQLLAFDLPQASAAADRDVLRTLLGAWTRTLSSAVTGPPPDPRLRGAGTARLTSLVGVGPALAARLNLAVPAGLADLPPFPGDRLDPARGGGDLLVQLCAEDRWTLAVVGELLTSAARTAGAAPRWAQSGFLPPTEPGATPRNLFGFKDGTANPDEGAAKQWVWGPPGPHENGTVLVYRRIRMDTAAFAALPEDGQNLVMGRRGGDGSPLTGTAEHDDPDIYAKRPDGSYVIPATAHVRLTSPRLDGGARMLRRGYSYDDGPGDRGLLFCAFMRDPGQFTRVQNRLAARDALNPFLEHTASAVAYVLPGAPEGTTLGEHL
ncbi:Dyp-type peroxidase [Kitasatospora sp. CM 4170]|uniref:Dyp-type peroxidase n=1 Tax=Kitasatospora aburaviensis TaxID=67265 RepID=A0ABW1F6A2_9ACTN|nr:Dyp-type peroxidase [Kitasatospora sp. CM 4170]WNM49828.1 Dyp-type peroxidase [Kitasatospora sp. CM 4170]